jgi:hypothetical protein
VIETRDRPAFPLDRRRLRAVKTPALLFPLSSIAAATVLVGSLAGLLAGSAACSSTQRTSGFGDDTDAGGGATGDAGVTPGNDGGEFGAGPDADVTTGPAEVYGHSPTTLYKLDPNTKNVTVVGDFDGCTSIIDIALDAQSRLFGTTDSSLYAIDRATAKCTHVAGGSYPNSLSFVPAGTVDPAVEALVGYVGSQYVRIDTASGATSDIGSIGGGYTSSGDIVSVKGGGTYLTVKGTGCDDCIVEVNPATGALIKKLGDIDHTDVFGLAYWGGSAYGFDNSGELFEITFLPTSVKATPIAMGTKPPGLQFWGAGSTTSAPVTPR